MLVIEASTGIMGWMGDWNHKWRNEPSDPIILYKCPKCGELEEVNLMKVNIKECGNGYKKRAFL